MCSSLNLFHNGNENYLVNFLLVRCSLLARSILFDETFHTQNNKGSVNSDLSNHTWKHEAGNIPFNCSVMGVRC